jgi:hypothetical protein
LAGFEMDPSGNPEVFRGVPRLSFSPIGSPLARTGDPTVKVVGEMTAAFRPRRRRPFIVIPGAQWRCRLVVASCGA